MAAPRQCVCHLFEVDKNELVLAFTDTSWQKLCDSISKWSLLDGKERVIAENFDFSGQEHYGYHRRCYQKFTDRRRLEQGQNRKEKGLLKVIQDESVDETGDQPFSKKLKVTLRSDFNHDTQSAVSERRSKHVLPYECIICRKSKTTLVKSDGKRKLEKLITCETITGKLLEAAKLKKDERIILQVGPYDPVSIEVRCHGSCYKQYTRCVYNEKERNFHDRSLTKSFEVFRKEVIEDKIISKGEVMKMSLLTKLFRSTVKETEDIDISSYRHFQLKSRLQKSFPMLDYIQPRPNCCELVFYNEDNSNQSLDIPASDTESDSESNDFEVRNSPLSIHSHREDFAQLYRAALIICSAIASTTGLSCWPPKSGNLSLEECMNIVLNELYNFLTWSCDVSSDFSTDKIPLDLQTQKKILSLSQDIISSASKGRKLMPKQVALGMTVRHLTGSSRLQSLLNGFGHCVSHSFTLEHDTALAVQQLHEENLIPLGFAQDSFTTLVWDNNDFGEETLTGKGTTHNTNGIIIQQPNPSDTSVSVSQETNRNSRDRKRTVEAPLPDMLMFHAPKRSGPDQFKSRDVNTDRDPDAQTRGKFFDQAYYLAKYSQIEGQIPSWTGFNQTLCQDGHPLSKIGYLPVIDASPTDKATVKEVLEKSIQIADKLHLPSVVVVMDQAIYAKVQEIRWQGRLEMKQKLVIRLGEFHTCMAFLAAIGKRFEHAGLKDIGIESGIVAEGSITGVMNGHHYNRSLRCHKIIAEALHRLRLQDFIEQKGSDTHKTVIDIVRRYEKDIDINFLNVIDHDAVIQFLAEYNAFVESRSKESLMYAFWSSYLQMVELLLLFIRATREGDWRLHLSTVRDMIPWFFAYGRINYSRYLPLYFLEMKDLASSHPFVHFHLSQGQFAVKRHNDHGFSLTACDQTIEQTFNKDSKTKGGLTGITLNKGAVRRWILSHPARASIANACYSMSGATSDASRTQSELMHARKVADEQAVQDVINTISNLGNPFTATNVTELFAICSGAVAPEDVKTDLITAYSKGELCFQKFVNERLEDGSKDLFDKLTLPSSKTFSDIGKSKASKLSVIRSSLKQDRYLFSRMLIMAQEKKLDLKDVLTYPLTSVPASLATPDGSLAKTTKSSLLHELESQVQDSSCEPRHNSVLIIDAMALIQQHQKFVDTFGQFAVCVLQQVISLARRYHADRVDFIGDRYLTDSIKQLERRKRAQTGETRVHIQSKDQKMPKQMKKYLACAENKEELLSFIANEWKKCTADMLFGVSLYVTDGASCNKLSVSEDGIVSEEIEELSTDHEEADTRMFLHVLHASKTCPTSTDIVIRSADTDVFVISLWVSSLVDNHLMILMSSACNSRTIDITKIQKAVGIDVVKAIVGLHPFTGCDTVSAFKSKGKIKALKLMMNNPHYLETFQHLGQDWSVSEHLQLQLEKFVCELYGWKGCLSVNEVRYNCFRFGYVGDASLPPNKDCLQLHSLRANYQACLNRKCILQHVCPPDPVGNGWKKVESQLLVKWNNMEIAPASILQSVFCKCKKSTCCSNKCTCRKSNIPCTDMCHCTDCTNRYPMQENSEKGDSGSDDSDVECDE